MSSQNAMRDLYSALAEERARNGKMPSPGQVWADVKLSPDPREHCFWTSTLAPASFHHVQESSYSRLLILEEVTPCIVPEIHTQRPQIFTYLLMCNKSYSCLVKKKKKQEKRHKNHSWYDHKEISSVHIHVLFFPVMMQFLKSESGGAWVA